MTPMREMPAATFDRPGAIDRTFNRLMGWFVGHGIGPSHMRLLEVRGRRTGALHSLPVDLLDIEGRLYLVAPRGETQWVRNAEAAGFVTLRRGASARRYALHPVGVADKPRILQAYLDRFHREVQRFFPVPAGSPPEAHAPDAARYPAFELEPCDTPTQSEEGSAC